MYPNKIRESQTRMQLTPQGVENRADDTNRIELNRIHGNMQREKGSYVTIFSLRKILNAKNLNSIESKSFKRTEKRENKFCQGVKRNQNDNFSFPSTFTSTSTPQSTILHLIQ